MYGRQVRGPNVLGSRTASQADRVAYPLRSSPCWPLLQKGLQDVHHSLHPFLSILPNPWTTTVRVDGSSHLVGFSSAPCSEPAWGSFWLPTAANASPLCVCLAADRPSRIQRN